MPPLQPISVGTELPATRIELKRVDVLRYCGSCGDYTGSHWNERIAKTVGLPDVISHGTLNAALATRCVTDWFGTPAAFVSYSVERFSHPVVVPDDDIGGAMTVRGRVEAIDEHTRICTVRLRAHTEDGKQVMGGARVQLVLPVLATHKEINRDDTHR